MTDLNERLAAMLDDEPPAPYDIDRVVTDGRRALRRRSALTAVAGVAGTAAVTAAIVVPLTTAGDGPTNTISVATQPTAQQECKSYLIKVGDERGKQRLTQFIKQHHNASSITGGEVRGGAQEVTVCPYGATPDTRPGGGASDPTATMPRYRYSEDPQAISDRLGDELTKQVEKLDLEIVYTRPFAQETATLDKGRPTYFGGNVDVQLADGPADIGVQVTHQVTEQVPFTDECDEGCTETTLADGSVMRVTHVDAGSGGAEVIVAEVHRPDGLVVQAQMSNYAFGPEATRDRTKDHPLTINQLTALAQNPAWTF